MIVKYLKYKLCCYRLKKRNPTVHDDDIKQVARYIIYTQ